jgi:hypothetical protein
VINTTIALNDAEYGGGLFCLSSRPRLVNTIVWYNVAEDGPQIFGNSPYITYSDIQGGWEGQGNIDMAPLFRDTTGDDFHLMTTDCGDSDNSPCIDAGDPAISDSLLDCSWGLGSTHSDMGAYGGGNIMTAVDDRQFDHSHRLTLARNYPNPFNISTSIRFYLPETTDLTVKIYNLLGQHVATLFEGPRQAGKNQITWHADDFPSGVYFARLKTPHHTETIKMVLLK